MNFALPPGERPPSALDLTLAALRPLLLDPDVTELCINRPGEAFIETACGWRREALEFADFDWCWRLAKLVANSTQQRIDATCPLLSAALPSGERVQIVIPPATTGGCVAIAIRRPADRVWSVAELGARGIFRATRPADSELDAHEHQLLSLLAARDYEAFMRLAVATRKNILVSGPTGSGKTTWTKALIREIPAQERLITIEDAQELVLDRHPNHVRLFYSKDAQGLARVTPKQLLESCLRMKPDRILLAELRGEEAFDYLRNVNSGHPGSITSVHAASAELAFEQLVLLVKQNSGGRDLARSDIKALLYMLIDVVIQFGVERHERFVKEIWYDPQIKRGAMAARRPARPVLNGWADLALAYGTVQVPMWIGMAKARAQFRHFVLAPTIAAPLLAVSAAVSGALFHGIGMANPAAAQWLMGAALGAALGYVAGRAPVRSAQEHIRGTVVEPRPPSREAANRVTGPEHLITVAGLTIAESDEAKHFKFIGTTGTGKSTAIAEILETALARGDRAVIADPDGGYARRFFRAERGDVILNPFDPRSVKWDLFAEIKTHYDVDELARSLIPDHEGADRSWRGYARTFFSAVTRQAHEAGIRDSAELYRLLVIADSQELRTLVAGTPAQPFLDEHNSRMFDSIRSVTSSAVGALEYISRQDSRDFSVRDWVDQESQGVLFIPYKAGQIAALRAPISAWMRLAIFETMNREEPQSRAAAQHRRLWFVIDELDALGQIDGLKDALARLRKFGGRCVLGFQSVSQVSSTYGPGDAHTIVENCGNTLILRCSASEGGGTARFASQLIGEREVLRTTESRSHRTMDFSESISRSQHFATEAAVMASQIEQLPDLTGYLKHASDPRWRLVQLRAKQAWAERAPQATRAGSNHGYSHE